MSKLVLVRHGISEWNKLGQWTGWTDIDLAPEGYEEAKHTAMVLKDIHFDYAFVSDLKRANETFKTMEKTLGYSIPFEISAAIKERNYGDLTGKNKWQVKQEFGDEQFNAWRRGWDTEIPNGENLKMVYARVVPFFVDKVLPMIKEDKNILISAHGNSIRALAKYLDKVEDSDAYKIEIATGEAFVYEMDAEGNVISKEIRATNSNKV